MTVDESAPSPAGEAPEPPRPQLPQELYSAYSGKEFETCVDCGGSLLDPPRMYQIVKGFNGSECVFEAAICFNCGNSLKTEMSAESLRNLMLYLRELTQSHGPSPHRGSWLHCSFCHQERAGSSQIGAVVFGTRQISPPLAICEECAAPAEERMSKQTRDSWHDFVDSNFPGVPANFDLPVFF